MNATFKVVFNKARGALMVVNEMTRSVQKKGTKTVVAAAVACLASGAAFAAVNPADAQYKGAGAFVTWNGEAPSVPDANPIVMTGAQAQAIGGSGKNWVSVVKSSAGASGTMNNLDIDLTAQGPNKTPYQDKQLILVLSQGGGINFGGDKLNVVAKTDFIGGGNNQLAGIYSEADAGNSMGISAKKVNVDLASTAADGKSVYGVSSLGGKVNITSDALNIKLKTSTERSGSTQYSETAGISAGTFGNFEGYRGYVGDITTSANTVVDVNVESTTATATKPNNDSEFGGGSPVFGIRSEGGLINLAGTNKVTAVANGADAHGVYAVNYAYNSSLGLQKFNSEATVNNLTAKVTSKKGTAYGVHAKNNADINTVAVNLTGDVDISASSTNSKGIYAVGQNVKMDVGEDGKTTRIVANGKGGQGIMTDTGAKLNVMGSSITVSATDEFGRGIAAWDGSTVNIGNEKTETVKVEGNFAGIISVAKGTTVNVVSKKIVVNSTDFGVHVQSNTEDPVAPKEHATLKLKADEITINSKSLGLSAFSNGQMDVTGNLTVTAENAIDVRGNSTMNINTDGKYTTVLNGNVVFETPNAPGDAQNSGKIINAYVNVGLHGENSVWTGRSYQEYKVNDKYEHIVELEADPYHGNVTGFKTEISNGGKWNVTGDSFVNTLNLQGNATVKGNDAVKRFNAGEITVTGANNELLFERGTEVNAHLTVKQNADLTTRVDTAFASTLNGGIVTAAASKANFVFEGGSTLHVDDAVKYTNAALAGMSKAYGNLSMVLDNGSLYVAPDAADRNIDIASNLTVNLKALGDKDLAGGADKFTIAGTVNVAADTSGSTPVTGVKLNDVYVSGTKDKNAALNLDNLQTTAKNLTVSDGTVSLKGETASLTVGDLNNRGTVDATEGTVVVTGTLDSSAGKLTVANLKVANGTDKNVDGFKTLTALDAGTGAGFTLESDRTLDFVAVEKGGILTANGTLTTAQLTNAGKLTANTLNVTNGTSKDGSLKADILNVAGTFALGDKTEVGQATVKGSATLNATTLGLTKLDVAQNGQVTATSALTAGELANAGSVDADTVTVNKTLTNNGTLKAKTLTVKDGSSKNGSLTAEVLNVAGAFELGTNELKQVNVNGGASLAAQTLELASLTVAQKGKLTAADALTADTVDNAGSVTVKSLDVSTLKGEGTLEAENIVFAEKNDLSGFKGAATLNGGTYELTDQNAVRWFGGKTTLTGASVNLSKLTNAEGTLANITVDGGSLTAVSGQIFKTKLADTYVADPEAIVTKAGLKSGTLTFVDAKYSVDYANKAGALIDGMTLVFKGSLVSSPVPEVPPAVTPKDDLKADDLTDLKADNKIVFDAALDNTEKSHDSLVIGSPDEVDGTTGEAQNIDKNLGVSQIKLSDKTNLVAVNSNRTLTLIGTGANESLIATETGATLEVGGKNTAGVLALGVQSDAVANAGTLNVDTNIGQKGLVEVNAGSFTASKTVTNNGQLVVKEGAALAVGGSLELKAGSNTAVEGILNTAKDAKLNVETGAKLALNGVAAIEQIDVTKHDNHEEALVTVGDNAKAGKAIIKKLGVGAEHLTFFLDPIWQEGAGISDASSLALTDLSSGVTSKFIVGQNSVLSLGATTAVAEQAFADIAHVNGKTWGEDITAAAYADKPVDLGSTGGLDINGGLTSSGTVVPPTAKDVNVASKGMLIINQDNVVADTAFFTAGSEDAKVTLANGSYVAIVNAVKDAAPVKLAETVDNRGADVVTDNPFFSGSIATNTLTTKFESEAGLAAIASTGIQSMARRADFVMSETVANRTSLDQQLNAGFNLWVDVTGERYEADKLDNNGSFRSDAGYAMFGGDMQVAEGFTAGMALQYGDASVRSDISSIKNSIKNYGLTAYAGQKFGDAKVVGELAWLKSENKITASQTAMNQKLDVNVYSAGVRAQYELAAGAFKFVPSIGLRVSHLETDDMTIGTIKATDSDLTYVQMPISLRISGGEVAASGWTFAPSFKVAYVPTFGDKEIKVYGASQDVLDMSPVQADFGLRAVNGNLMFNADMMIGGGEYGTSSIGGKVGVKYVF
ncbi:autotransporter domain-containing protein [Duodenibacillus massiliensis]|uniref:autotransporter domain-containing protein n=1 Tax=Duodenibacillus massiliensis TaxID=1852381 RepID=UPI003AB71924